MFVHHDGFSAPSRGQDRGRRRGVCLGEQQGQKGATETAGPGDDRLGQGPLLHEEPPGILRVQTLSHAPQQRRLLILLLCNYYVILGVRVAGMF